MEPVNGNMGKEMVIVSIRLKASHPRRIMTILCNFNSTELKQTNSWTCSELLCRNCCGSDFAKSA
ncbi:hypothetical protein PROFUN_12379 [Planoprotostelium fungivorum]|uniref:Uncharacterized protein n=1 Tax=Planoprotostelium fungivorum TaxID=1890364 RepID=A0A2P6N7H6_9EUKA|nr:hypothetical protein PROFUN_12379 [Planoprotostelium fungivorum]